MTDPDMADRTYIEPITPEIVAKIIAKERYAIPGGFALCRPWAARPASIARSLEKNGLLEKIRWEMIGASASAIDMAKDRKLFPKP